jgi:hypothetical protein
MGSTEHSLVMGFAAGLPTVLLTPFFESLRATSYRGRTCLFLSRMAQEDIEKLRLVVDDVVVLDGAYHKRASKAMIDTLRWLRNTRRIRRIYPLAFKLATVLAFSKEGRRQRRRWLEYCLEGLQSLRYEHYLEYLSAQQYDQVLISDIRDVIFQGDPFAHDVQELELVLEDSRILIRTEPFNRRWMKNLYGAPALERYGNDVVSCSGTTLGTAKGIARYLRAMISEIRKQKIPLGSHDQGIHNFLLRCGKLDPVKVYVNEEGPIITVGKQEDIKINGSNQVTNRNGDVPAVVHQYDRHGWLVERLQRELEVRKQLLLSTI